MFQIEPTRMDNNVESINHSFSKKLVSVDAPKTKKVQNDTNGEPTTPKNMYDFFLLMLNISRVVLYQEILLAVERQFKSQVCYCIFYVHHNMHADRYTNSLFYYSKTIRYAFTRLHLRITGDKKPNKIINFPKTISITTRTQ